jgi:hypothetical protein
MNGLTILVLALGALFVYAKPHVALGIVVLGLAFIGAIFLIAHILW